MGRKSVTGPVPSLPGFTLVEILTGTAITAFLIVIIGSLYFAHFKIFSNQNMFIEVNSQAKLALDDIIAQIRQSESIVSTCAGCGGDTTSATILVLRLWSLDGSGEPIDPGGTVYDYIVYKRDPTDDTKLIRKIIPDVSSTRRAETKIISNSITDLTFTYNNADPTASTEITAGVTATRDSFGKAYTSTQEKKALLGNK